MARFARPLVPAALAALSLLHLAWAAGWRQPGGSDHAWAESVVGHNAEVPSAAALWSMPVALAVAAWMVAAASRPQAPRLVRCGGLVVAAVLLARGVTVIPIDLANGLEHRFDRLDLALYSPLCLVLGAGALIAIGRSRANTGGDR